MLPPGRPIFLATITPTLGSSGVSPKGELARGRATRLARGRASTLARCRANKDTPFPVSFIYGDSDWVNNMESGAGKIIVDANQNPESKFHIVPKAGHNLHMDNPREFAQTLINDVFGEGQPLVAMDP